MVERNVISAQLIGLANEGLGLLVVRPLEVRTRHLLAYQDVSILLSGARIYNDQYANYISWGITSSVVEQGHNIK